MNSYQIKKQIENDIAQVISQKIKELKDKTGLVMSDIKVDLMVHRENDDEHSILSDLEVKVL